MQDEVTVLLERVSTMPFSQQLAVVLVAGVASHLLWFIHGEHHMQAPAIFKIYTTMAGVVFALYAVYGPLLEMFGARKRYADVHLISFVSLYLAYFLSLFTSVIVYRIFFHRLRRFPGPPLAKATKFWHVFKVLRKDNYVLLEEFRKKYGDYVRTGKQESTNASQLSHC